MTQNRQPKGIPAGGEFAKNEHGEAEGALASPVQTIRGAEVRKGDLVDMTALVSSYQASMYDPTNEDEPDMEGTYTVTDVRRATADSIELTVSNADHAYVWYVSDNQPVDLVSRPSAVPQRLRFGDTADATRVAVEPYPSGSGQSFDIALQPGGHLRLDADHLDALGAGSTYQNVWVVRAETGETYGIGEVNAGRIARTPQEHQTLDLNRKEIDAELYRIAGVRLKPGPVDWDNPVIHVPVEVSSNITTTSDGTVHISTDDVGDRIRDISAPDFSNWLRGESAVNTARRAAGMIV